MKNLLLTALFLFVTQQTVLGIAIPLTVKNNINTISRVEVPVQMGIPFPKGKLAPEDVAKLTVSDSITGNAIPAGVAATVLWHDGSVRWIRLLFPATIVGTTKSTYILSDANMNPDGGIQATESGNTVTVVTGPLKFIVKGANFNLIDEAWVNETLNLVFSMMTTGLLRLVMTVVSG